MSLFLYHFFCKCLLKTFRQVGQERIKLLGGWGSAGYKRNCCSCSPAYGLRGFEHRGSRISAGMFLSHNLSFLPLHHSNYTPSIEWYDAHRLPSSSNIFCSEAMPPGRHQNSTDQRLIFVLEGLILGKKLTFGKNSPLFIPVCPFRINSSSPLL